MSTLDEVARFPTMVEATVAQSFLQSYGIETVLAEANIYAALPIGLSRGGFRLMAPRQEIHAAKTLLAGIRSRERYDDENSSL